MLNAAVFKTMAHEALSGAGDMIMRLARSICASCLVALLCAPANAAVRHLWAVNDGEKIERDDLGNAHKRSNSAWDGKRIKLFGARNEIIAFQLIVEADEGGINGLSAALPAIKHQNLAVTIKYAPPAIDPTDYVDRPIQLFSVNYLWVEKPSRADWIFRPGSPAAPADPLGWKPVQLIPENARANRGGFPLLVKPRQNQAIWCEIYLNKNLPAGNYQGIVEVRADNITKQIPLELELFDFTLPDTNSMEAMLYYESRQPELYQGRNLDAEFHRFAHRQRVELVHGYELKQLNTVSGRFTGTDFTKSNKYEGPGEGIGNRIIPASFYGPGKEYEERSRAWKKSDAWMTFIKENYPQALTFLYMPDEPGPSEYAHIRRLASHINSNPGPGKNLPIFVTKQYVKELDGAIDIWATGPLWYDIARAGKERARGRRYWIYNSGRPAAGAIIIDSPATDARATIWSCFKHNVEVYFYWHGVHWLHNAQKQGERRQNVWSDPITFDNRGQPRKPIADQGYVNGDGVLIYPGEEKIHVAEDRGIRGPVSTVQLANLRRGLQDHQYLTLARKLGLHSLVKKSVQRIVPRVFSDAPEKVSFSESGNDYETVRYELAQSIANATAKR